MARFIRSILPNCGRNSWRPKFSYSNLNWFFDRSVFATSYQLGSFDRLIQRKRTLIRSSSESKSLLPSTEFDRSRLRLPLPREVPMAFRVLPEYLLEDVVEYLSFTVTSVSHLHRLHTHTQISLKSYARNL